MKRLGYIFFLFLGLSIIPIIGFQKEVVSYSYAGNFKGYLNNPYKKGKHPVIIYNYDQYYDWAGETIANDKGYVLENFMKTFEKWGYISFIPIERYRKGNAIKGAIQYVLSLPNVDPNQIHIVGMGEGAFMSLIVLPDLPKVASLSLIVPDNLNNNGYYSFPNLARRMKYIDTRIFLLISEDEQLWRIKSQLLIERLLEQEKKEVYTTRYPVPKKWFFNYRNSYMTDIKNFIKYDKVSTYAR